MVMLFVVIGLFSRNIMKVLHNGTFICALDALKAGIHYRMFALVYSLDESTLVARSPSQSVIFFIIFLQ